ncbi:hypothetical protein LIER_14695 [Lithospermum erythrorhizon]|uniref:Uncharacterized protein n=1 Tax=Lithospermum erythrorhizon TaxID=34254 RepID=A0AAV3Q1N8_LITER
MLASLCIYDCSDEIRKAFCEHWCPSTNTLIILQGELSISLWNLLDLGGLSVVGRLFDEVVPTAECLSQSLSEESRLPAFCRFLLLGYYYLVVQFPDGRVSASAWISFWTILFGPMWVMRQLIGAHPRAFVPENCLYLITVLGMLATDILLILWESMRGLEEEVYCDVFLSYWLCVFVLPAKSLGFIRAGVFKMESFMANGYRVSVGPVVLSCI